MRPLAKAIGATVVAGTCLLAGLQTAAAQEAPEDRPAASAQADKKNIIFVLTDDLSRNLVPYMSALSGPDGLKSKGTSFGNYYVADSLCCPSRVTIFTGELPHNTGVRTNTNEDGDGGYAAFREKKHENRTYAAALDANGYRTGYLGKYLNGYNFKPGYQAPKGWDEWHVAGGGGYSEFDYRITRFIKDAPGGPVRKIDRMKRDPQNPDSTYLTDVLARRATSFVERSAGKPFFLQVSTFAPHSRGKAPNDEPRFPPAVRDRPRSQGGETEHGDCGPTARCDQVRHPRTDAFDEDTADKPAWVRKAQLTGAEKRSIDTKHRDRVRMVQSVNDLLKKVLGSLTPAQRANTYVVFSSDNGFHLGQHRLLSGKGSAYDHDVQVPLIVTGPGVKHQSVGRIAQNIDLYPTFLRMAGINPPNDRDGHSLLGLAKGEQPQQWRKSALVEHKRLDSPADPDAELAGGNSTAPTYSAIRTADALFVKDASGATEYYDLPNDAGQLNNKPNAAPDWIKEELGRMIDCGKKDEPTCWAEGLDTRN